MADGALKPMALAARCGTPGAPPSLDSGKLLLRHMPIAWAAWVKAWEPDAGPAACAAALNGIRVFPEVPSPDLTPVATM